MSDPKPIFRSLLDASNNALALAKAVLNTTDPIGKAGSIAFAFRKSTGEVTMPTLNAGGELPVTFEGSGTKLKARGVATDPGTSAFVTLTDGTITLALEKVYTGLELVGAARSGSHMQVIYNDDGTENIELDLIMDSGDHTSEVRLQNWSQSTVGKANTQELFMHAKNFDRPGNVYGAMTTTESA